MVSEKPLALPNFSNWGMNKISKEPPEESKEELSDFNRTVTTTASDLCRRDLIRDT